MERDPNSSTDSYGDQSLPRSRILRGKRSFRQLFESGSALHTSSLQFRYRLLDDPDEGILIAFIAPRRLGHAVLRNRLKRRLREAYRMQQHLLIRLVAGYGKGLHGAFMAKQADLSYQTIHSDINRLVGKLQNRLESGHNRKHRNNQ